MEATIPRTFTAILNSFRERSFSERDKGDRFERLMQAYLQTDPRYSNMFSNVWLWTEFPSKADFGGKDMGIDLVAKTRDGEYWAVQCKCYKADSSIDKSEADSFLSTSGKKFRDDNGESTGFSYRLWISTTNKWGANAEEAIRNQHPPVNRINLHDLEEAPVDWEKLEAGLWGANARSEQKEIRPHQQEALDAAHEYFKTSDRGQLIMACGTGKTYTSLQIAEYETGGKGLILFLVPSISLLSQSLREWSAEAKKPIHAICICSDAGVSKKKALKEDIDGSSTVDLALPASTDVKSIVRQFKRAQNAGHDGMTVVFSTYQSIDVIAKAQQELLAENGRAVFDLIICDEAHRTTGVKLAGENESSFVKVHDNDFLKGKKRLYMTATPRLYKVEEREKAEKAEALVWSMDKEEFYGKEIYRIGFGKAVEAELLSDYKVLVLTIGENDLPSAVQKILTNPHGVIESTDASKLIGCINALSKRILGDEGSLREHDPEPMRRAVAFCQNINISQKISNSFNDSDSALDESLSGEEKEKLVSVSARHIDGSMSAPVRDEMLGWLKSNTDDERECRVLTNVRCLSEGVDVPSLDAVLFLSPRNSQVDVVQSVGRVMRKTGTKKYGYIIIPIVVPANVEAERALDNDDNYKVVWSVLNALRSHDDRFDATVNKIELNKKKPGQILIGRASYGFSDEELNILNEPQPEYKTKIDELKKQLMMDFEQLQGLIFARLVKKVGQKAYWENWAKDVAKIAERQIERINRLIKEDDKHRKAFERFLKGLRKNINPFIIEEDAVEMLSQHIITKPVFEALFEGYSFAKNNPVSLSMQKMIDLLEEGRMEKETETLDRFYESVKMRAAKIDNAEGKQKVIIELYDKFFKAAFPKMVEKLGIVYTPTEVVDFIIHSVDAVFKKEFGQSISDEGIHILDPFTGTGTFMTRLLQSGVIRKEDLQRKYEKELHANEIVLLAYYIAAINIENVFHDITNSEEYVDFKGICLTDTFQLGEDNGELFSDEFPQNSKRVEVQKKLPIRVIIGNPPYSIGQKSANDNAQNQEYSKLNSLIANSYAAESSAGLNKSSYDAYIKAFRWSTDRLDAQNGGIICFVSNGAWLDGNSSDGFRKCVEREFSSIYVFNLRGNQRTSGELSRKEGGKIFGSGSRTPISISLLVKNPNVKTGKAIIQYHDIGDYLSREEKLDIIRKYNSIGSNKMTWITLAPNEHGDWLSQRNDLFERLIPIEPSKKYDLKSSSFFVANSLGLLTARDTWAYNYSKNKLLSNMSSMIDFYEAERLKFQKLSKNIETKDAIAYDAQKIGWTHNLIKDLEKGVKHTVDRHNAVRSSYRPFVRQFAYYDRNFNERVYQLPKLFPTKKELRNLVIVVMGLGASRDFSVLISDALPNYDFIEKSQCFPLYFYDEKGNINKGLFDEEGDSEYIRCDGISDFILERARNQFGKNVSKEDIFYYVYGFLYSSDYRDTFSSDLKKTLPRLPLLEDVKDFWSFSKAGRKLAELHIHYESVPAADGVMVYGEELGNYRVIKMRFPKKGEKSTIIYNDSIRIENIPAAAYEYVVNGKSAIEWIMERYQVTTHRESGIKNDPNDWADEVGNPRYILDLLLSIIRVSVETMEIVKGLPKLIF